MEFFKRSDIDYSPIINSKSALAYVSVNKNLEKNSLDIPYSLADCLGVGEGDFVEVLFKNKSGIFQILDIKEYTELFYISSIFLVSRGVTIPCIYMSKEGIEYLKIDNPPIVALNKKFYDFDIW